MELKRDNIFEWIAYICVLAASAFKLSQKMKIIISLLSTLFLFNSCSFKNYDNFLLESEYVKTASIKDGMDNLPIELSKEQTDELLKELNKSKKNGPTKYMKKYWVQFQLENDSTITIGCNNSIFSVNSALAYKTSDNYFDNYWNKIEGEKKSWKLYKPVEYKNDKLIQNYSQNFDSIQLKNLKSILDYYGIENKIVEEKIYYNGIIEQELNWNYMTKSKDEKWLNEHKSTSR